ncbi:GIY-YIG nuclease family protein [Methylosinus sp. Sm6]|uniref:GIY-YIG nuclease family protein n=1 Tax=Methylosinus sp. Sm6 TaxID=2866948 RepID=UPI001C997EA9|nr:GIY-YIG nuclease family protein [Methylosinus sp. Sm6]MBY6243358.1 GIY-YIG nuclease family protein [Methylosinus sp. Sm6]
MHDMDDDELLAALEISDEEKEVGAYTPLQERVIAGFEDIVRFVREHGRRPSHGEDRDIFERLYAVRLDRLRDQGEFHALLALLDEFGLLSGGVDTDQAPELEDDEALLAELEIEDQPDSITTLKHVKPYVEINAAEEVARRTPCADFDEVKALFERVKKDLDQGSRRTRRFKRDAEIKEGEFFVLGGQMAYVAKIGEEFLTEQDRRNAKLRVIFDNKTESHGLMRSFQRALYKDGAGRRVTAPGAGPLFDEDDDDDAPELPSGDESGTIYVLRSKSSDPGIASKRAVLHKIGVTGNDVEKRISNAEVDPTFLMAGVEVVATYRLFHINRSRLENLIHRFFSAARLDLELKDRFEKPVRPQEWFLVPLPVIDEVVHRIEDRTIVDFEYDLASASLKRIERIADL